MGAPKKRAREGSAFDAESMGAPGRSTNAGADPLAALGDAGMVLRDPATMRLIIHHVGFCGPLSFPDPHNLSTDGIFKLVALGTRAWFCETRHHAPHHLPCKFSPMDNIVACRGEAKTQ